MTPRAEQALAIIRSVRGGASRHEVADAMCIKPKTAGVYLQLLRQMGKASASSIGRHAKWVGTP